jgi:hypothetical protein
MNMKMSAWRHTSEGRQAPECWRCGHCRCGIGCQAAAAAPAAAGELTSAIKLAIICHMRQEAVHVCTLQTLADHPGCFIVQVLTLRLWSAQYFQATSGSAPPGVDCAEFLQP